MLATTQQTKHSKSHFKCFNCRLVTSRRDGDWVNWNEMQVHLCPPCVKATATYKERALDTITE